MTADADFRHAAAVVADGVQRGAFPAATVEVGTDRAVLWRQAFGRPNGDLESPPATVETIFDLGSLTKVVSTTSIAMQQIDAGRLHLEEPLSSRLRDWRGSDRKDVTVRDLLAHASGLSAYLPLYRDCTGRQEFEHVICRLPLEYPPRSESRYSDLGFILLGFILEDAGAADLERLFAPLAASVGPEPLGYRPPAAWRGRCAPTEVDRWRGRLLVGEVHDENAWALGGVAAHSGLFGTAVAVGRFAQLVLRTLDGESLLCAPDTLRTFLRRTDVPGSSRALGWDTMLPTSSCGHRMSAAAVGHTGFTGTSVWIDPDARAYVVLLTNRVHPTRENELIQPVRRAFHDAVMAALEMRRVPRGPV